MCARGSEIGAHPLLHCTLTGPFEGRHGRSKRRNGQPSFSRYERAARRRGGCRGVYLFDSVRVLHASTFSDIHLCCVHTSRLEKREQITHLTWFPQSLGALVGGWTAHHRSVDVPEGSLLAVQDLPLGFIFLPVDPVGEISRRENCSSFADIRTV